MTAVLMDRTGFLWVGTMDGLARFDGHDFHVFRHDPADSTSLSSNQIGSLTETRDGTLWVGTEGGGINRLSPESGPFERLGRDGMSNFGGSTVEAVLEDSQGRLWVGLSSGGLARMGATA